MSNTNVTKGERLLKALADAPNVSMTPDGAAFVQQRFDPYHDKPMKPVGYCDSFNGHTVSRCIKKSVTFTQTSGGSAAQATPWDCSIFMTPLAKPVPLTISIARTGNVFTFNAGSTPTKNYGGLMIVGQMTSGSAFEYPVPASATTQMGQLSLTDADMSGSMRVTSMGFEVIDGTAELYRQGILTAYRQNQPQKEPGFWEGWASTGDNANEKTQALFSGHVMKFPPTSTANALAIPDTKQWKVSEGAYCSVDYHNDAVPIESPSYVAPLMIYDVDSATSAPDETPIYFPAPVVGHVGITYQLPNLLATLNLVRAAHGQRILPINQSGVILTGLNPLATITVNCIWYVECAPTSDDQELLSLCSQSPAYDPLAMMMISKLRRDSPICVKLRENYTGEWFFNGIKDIVKKVVPWFSNATVVGNQMVKWIDTAGTNDGYINPQSFVKGDVAVKVSREKNPKTSKPHIGKGVIPKAPGRAPAMRAYNPKTPHLPSKKKIMTSNKLLTKDESERKRIARLRARMKKEGLIEQRNGVAKVQFQRRR